MHKQTQLLYSLLGMEISVISLPFLDSTYHISVLILPDICNHSCITENNFKKIQLDSNKRKL